jgi:hypothetical protein
LLCRFNGSYAGLDGGNLADALVDFTGGVAEMIQLRDEASLLLFKVTRRKIGLIESNAKNVVILKKLTCKGTLRQVFICLRPPSPPRFLFGVVAVL